MNPRLQAGTFEATWMAAGSDYAGYRWRFVHFVSTRFDGEHTPSVTLTPVGPNPSSHHYRDDW